MWSRHPLSIPTRIGRYGHFYDTDGDFNRFKPAPLKRFDNGFFRFAMTW